MAEAPHESPQHIAELAQAVRVVSTTSPKMVGVYTRMAKAHGDGPSWTFTEAGGYVCKLYKRNDLNGRGPTWILDGPGYQAVAWNVDTPGPPLFGWDRQLEIG